MNKIKILNKILIISLILFVMSFICNNYVYAADSIGDVFAGADEFISKGEEGEQKISSDNLDNLSDQIYNVLLAIGIVASVIVGLILGIQFMTGSVEAKSKVKEALLPYVTGCIVIFGAFGIWKLVVTILQSI